MLEVALVGWVSAHEKYRCVLAMTMRWIKSRENSVSYAEECPREKILSYFQPNFASSEAGRKVLLESLVSSEDLIKSTQGLALYADL